MTAASRRILPTRRGIETFEFEADNIKYVASVGLFPDGSPSEVFVNSKKIDTSADVAIGDAAVALSIAFQYGVPADVIRHAMKRDANGQPRGPLGKLLDMLAIS